MNPRTVRSCLLALSLSITGLTALAEGPENTRFRPIDVFDLEYASDPQVSPDGERIVYVRNFMDIMSDRVRSNLWTIQSDGEVHRPLTDGSENHSSPRWSPDGKRLAYVSNVGGSPQIHLRWMDTGQTARISHLVRAPGRLTWSPDGQWLAFTMKVPKAVESFVDMPPKPEGAKWAKPAKVIQKLQYRADGEGYLEDGYDQIFLLSTEGGTARQLTSGSFNHSGSPSWTPDGKFLIFSANRHENWEYDPQNSEVYELEVASGSVRVLTSRQGPDAAPVVSPDGSTIAYLGYDDAYQGYQVTRLSLMNRDGTGHRVISANFDRDVQDPRWKADGRGLFFQYDDEGNSKVASISTSGEVSVLAHDLGGNSIGRPYSGGSYSVSPTGTYAYTYSRPDFPADVAVGRGSDAPRRITRLNDDLLGYKELARVEEIWYQSSFDGRRIQGWIATPPGFDSNRKYPLILEIHGGPFANYGDRFSAEVQLYASAGYVVLYTNPRGSTSYGGEFGNLIHHNYPSQDFDDLMSGVDAVIAKGSIDTNNLFVTGGSGGGVLSSWTVGMTDRFAAAVVAKPVINWYSFVLTADVYNFFYKYWFPGYPWDHLEHYMKRSPLSLVGKVTTPTMLLTGEEDYRTPMSESEQYYQALKLRKVPAALVRIPGASHGIARRPSNLIGKVAHILKWFEMHQREGEGGAAISEGQ